MARSAPLSDRADLDEFDPRLSRPARPRHAAVLLTKHTDMDRHEIGKILRESASRARGYADFFDWPDKSVKEWGIAETFVEELQRSGGPTIRCGKQHPGGPNHAPDFQITTDSGETCGVEITELVSQQAIEATKRGSSVFADWSDAELTVRFEELVAKKDRSENVKGGPYDRFVLLVPVDEVMLSRKQLECVLGSRSFPTHLIDEIYVLMSYDPREQCCPLLRFNTTKAPLRKN
jgi:hypothetical protein